MSEHWWNRKKGSKGTTRSCSWKCVVAETSFGSSSVASFFFFFCFSVASKSSVPEGDFEKSDLSLFCGFVSATHAVVWSLREPRIVGSQALSPYYAMFCICETHKFTHGTFPSIRPLSVEQLRLNTV